MYSLIATPTSADQLARLELEQVWAPLANAICADIYAAELSAAPDPEWLLWNKILLSRFFHGCRLSSARYVSAHLATVMRGLHGPRSAFVAIVQRIDSNGISGPPVPQVSPAPRSATSFRTGQFSDLLKAVQYERIQIGERRGLVHRVVDVNRPVTIPAHVRGTLTLPQLVEYRDRYYRQYEASILCYGVLSAIEQLLRSFATHTGVTHLKKAGTPAPVGDWLDDPKLQLDTVLLETLRQLYAADGANLRNRAMHAGLLEIDSKRPDVLLDGLELRSKLSNDPLVPENLLEVFMECLQMLDGFVAAQGLRADDFSWTRQLWLSPEELEFALTLHCDVLDPENWSGWQRELFDFVDGSIGCFSTYLKVAWYGWMMKFEPDNSVLSFLVWGVFFEAIFRLTVHILGFDVIQRSSVKGDERMFQYRMLDERPGSLCQKETISALVKDLQPEERPLAEKTITLAVKTRNALSHGAIVVHDESDHLGAGHLFIKATQLLMFATVQHMTRIGAYYRSLTGSDPADPVSNWLTAENDIYDMIVETAASRRNVPGGVG